MARRGWLEALLVSVVQDYGLTSDGVRGFRERCELEYSDKERSGDCGYTGQALAEWERSYLEVQDVGLASDGVGMTL